MPKNQQKLSPKDISKSIIEFSQIFDEDSHHQSQNFITTKTNILLILLCFTVYSIYNLFSDYLDTMLLAFLSGVAYRQLRDRFIGVFKRNPNYVCERDILTLVVQVILFFVLPWIRNQSKMSIEDIDFSPSYVWECFLYSSNPLVRIPQIYLFVHIAYGLFGETLHRWLTFQNMTNGKKKMLRVLFAVITVITALLLLVALAVVLATEVGRGSKFATDSIERAYDCEFNPNNNSLAVPCASKISANISQYLPKIQNQTQYRQCIEYINKTQISYLGYDIFDYEQNICGLLLKIKSVSPNIIQGITLRGTGAVVASVFGFIANFLSYLIDVSFSLSTFFTIFIVTVTYFQFTTKHIYIFGESKSTLVKDITNILSATIFIALQHLALGIVLFQIFRFTAFNTILSILLSVIAFVPLVKPSFIVLIITPIQIWFSGEYITPIACWLLYTYFSGRIYAKYYSKVSLHIVLVNLSVIFGIYQFGVSGIFYGPLIITLFQCVYSELFQRK